MANYYHVYKNGAYMGETCVVSEKQAINNVRHREEGDYSSQYDCNWSAILQEPEYILYSPRRCAEPDLTKDNFRKNRIYCRHGQYHGRDYNYINGAWT